MAIPSWRRSWLLLLKLAISATLVLWIVKDVDFTEMGAVLAQTNIMLLVVAFCLFFLGYFLTAFRWRLLMSIHGVRPPLNVLVQSFMVGIFFNNLLPTKNKQKAKTRSIILVRARTAPISEKINVFDDPQDKRSGYRQFQ